MAREIKFRAWVKDEQFMMDLSHMFFSFPKGTLFQVAQMDNCYSLEDVELVQYTGLKDKNGKEIYEGDLVKNSTGATGEVKFGEHDTDSQDWNSCGAYGFYFSGKRGREEALTDEYRIVGNVHENPELLEKK